MDYMNSGDQTMGGSPIDVNEYLKKKYGFGEYSPDARAQLVQGVQEAASPIASAISAFGAGIAGRDVGSAFNNAMSASQAGAKEQLNQFDVGKKNALEDKTLLADAALEDPNSQDSKIARDYIKSIGFKGDSSNLTAAQIKPLLPYLQKKYESEQSMLSRKIDRAEDRDFKEKMVGLKALEMDQAKNEKKKAAVVEVENRRQDIEDNLSALEGMIKDKGTYELFGSHNQDLERKIDQVATDMAKLADPSSVARPSEVDMVKKNLIQAGFKNKNATALDILKNFREEVNKRAANAYKIRGLSDPGSKFGSSPQGQPSSSGGRFVVKKLVSPSTGKTKLMYSDGTEEIIGGQ